MSDGFIEVKMSVLALWIVDCVYRLFFYLETKNWCGRQYALTPLVLAPSLRSHNSVCAQIRQEHDRNSIISP